VELADVAGQGLSGKLLAAMGADLGAIHAAHRRRASIFDDVLSRGGPQWLHRAANAAERSVRRDFEHFKSL
jgi:hypothetical protein